MTEEFIEPTPQGRRNLLLLLAGLLVFFLSFQKWLAPAYLDYVHSLPPCDQISHLEKFIFFFMCFPTIAGIWGVNHARKVIKFKQIPLPGTWVLNKTPVKRGRAVVVQAYFGLILSIVLGAFPIWGRMFIDSLFVSLEQKHRCSYNSLLNQDWQQKIAVSRQVLPALLTQR